MALEDFMSVSDFDFQSIYMDMDIPSFYDELTKLYCVDVDFNGHFGANIYLCLEVEDDTPERWKDIERVFDQYIKIAREWEEAEKELENT